MGVVTYRPLADAVTIPAQVPALRFETISGEVDSGATRLANLLSSAQLAYVSRRIGMTIPAMRAGHAQITKRPGTWPLRCWAGDRLTRLQPAWLTNPDPRLTFAQLIAETLDDAVWDDRAYWAVTRRAYDGFPLAYRRIAASRVQDDENGILVDGKPVHEALDIPGPVVLQDGRILESLIPMRWSGLGGLAREGRVIVDLALSLLATATNQAKVPLPDLVLEDSGTTRLEDSEVEAMIEAWEVARQTHSTAYTRGVKATPVGYSARELQLVEGREHSALEIARAMSLPASAVQASNGASLEYSTVVENRRELVEACRLWTAPIEQALSLHAVPRGVDVRFDVTSYLRDDPSTRVQTWATAKAAGILTDSEIRSQEPLATEGS